MISIFVVSVPYFDIDYLCTVFIECHQVGVPQTAALLVSQIVLPMRFDVTHMLDQGALKSCRASFMDA